MAPKHRPETFKFAKTDVWREGEWVDLWSVVHILTGVSIGLGFFFLRFGAFASVALAILSLVSYEMWEMIVHIKETPANRFMDVVAGMAGFAPAFFLLPRLLAGAPLVALFALVLAADIVMSFFGWRASQKAAALQESLLARYAVERARLLRQGVRLREKFRRDD